MMQKEKDYIKPGYYNQFNYFNCDFIAPSDDILNVRNMFFLFEVVVSTVVVPFVILVCYAFILFQVYRSRTFNILNETGLVAQILL